MSSTFQTTFPGDGYIILGNSQGKRNKRLQKPVTLLDILVIGKQGVIIVISW